MLVMKSRLLLVFGLLAAVSGWVVDKRSLDPATVVQGDALIVIPPIASGEDQRLEKGSHAASVRGIPPARFSPPEGKMASRNVRQQQQQRQADNEDVYNQVKESVRRSVGFPSDSNYTCKNFLKIENSVSLKGEVLVNLQDHSPEACKQRCIDETKFACLAAFIQHPANCFLSGFYIRPDPRSDHYYRTCDHGSKCFIKQENHSSGTHQINKVIIPWYFPNIKYTYCMALCEQMTSCVGFDIVDKPPRCVFQDLQRYTDYSFDMFLRQC